MPVLCSTATSSGSKSLFSLLSPFPSRASRAFQPIVGSLCDSIVRTASWLQIGRHPHFSASPFHSHPLQAVLRASFSSRDTRAGAYCCVASTWLVAALEAMNEARFPDTRALYSSRDEKPYTFFDYGHGVSSLSCVPVHGIPCAKRRIQPPG